MYSTCPDCRKAVWHDGTPHVCGAPTGAEAEVIKLRSDLEAENLQIRDLTMERDRLHAEVAKLAVEKRDTWASFEESMKTALELEAQRDAAVLQAGEYRKALEEIVEMPDSDYQLERTFQCVAGQVLGKPKCEYPEYCKVCWPEKRNHDCSKDHPGQDVYHPPVGEKRFSEPKVKERLSRIESGKCPDCGATVHLGPG